MNSTPLSHHLSKVTVLAAMLVSGVVNAGQLPDFTSLIKNNANTVVQIDSRDNGKPQNKRSRSQQNMPPQTPEDLLRYFFENPNGRSPSQPQQRPSRSHGSGFFIDDSGYILTNAHVVRGGDEITVSTTDQTEYTAELVGMDERTDVALLKVTGKNLPAAKIGDSDTVEVGNWVLAIGSPFGFDYTATKGIVSAVSRSLPDGTYVPFIQTDAAVNPGNSGGPLFNLDGEVIGINSQIYSSTGSFNGLAFAIPINTAMNIAEQLKNKGFVSRGWLGVAIQNVDQDLARSFGLKKPRGALVSAVVEESPAENAGIKAGDIILTFNGKQVKKSSALPPMVGTVEVGKNVPVELLRAGKKQTIDVTIGELDEGNKPVAGKTTSSNATRGLNVANLTRQQKDSLALDEGVIVRHVKTGSVADKAGFQAGDVIVNVNNQAVADVKAFQKAMDNIPADKPVAVLVIRQGRSLFVPL